MTITRHIKPLALFSALSVLAVLLALAPGASAQATDEPIRVELLNDYELDHFSYPEFTVALEPNTRYTLTQCSGPSNDATCVERGGSQTDDTGVIDERNPFGFAVLREMFVDGVRSDCAEMACEVRFNTFDDDVTRAIMALEFSSEYPMAELTVSPATDVQPGDVITVEANEYRSEIPGWEDPEDRPEYIELCAAGNEASWTTCKRVADINPGETVTFKAPRFLGVELHDCANAACVVTIANYSAQWAVDFVELPPATSAVEYGVLDALVDGSEVEVTVTSPQPKMSVFQCVVVEKQRGCKELDSERISKKKTDGVLTQTFVAEVQQVLWANDQRQDCAQAETKCMLQVVPKFGGGPLGKAGQLAFTSDPLPVPKPPRVRIPQQLFSEGDTIRVRMRNMPVDFAEKFVVYQCVEGPVTSCERLTGGKLKKSSMRRNVTLLGSIKVPQRDGSTKTVDCTTKAGRCSIAVATMPNTGWFRAPLTFG